jgi:hypothetical protein
VDKCSNSHKGSQALEVENILAGSEERIFENDNHVIV